MSRPLKNLTKKIFYLCFLTLYLFQNACSSLRVNQTSLTTKRIKTMDAALIFKKICAIGSSIQSIQGTAWMKMALKQRSAQFPINIYAEASSPTGENGKLKIEVINFLGGTETSFILEPPFLSIFEIREKASQKKILTHDWNGIPIGWIQALFIGKIPCSLSQTKQLSLQISQDQELLLESKDLQCENPEIFVYKLKEKQNKEKGVFFIESLLWEELKKNGKKLEFKFDTPEEVTLSPKKWEVKTLDGSIKLKWKERKITVF